MLGHIHYSPASSIQFDCTEPALLPGPGCALKLLLVSNRDELYRSARRVLGLRGHPHVSPDHDRHDIQFV